MYFGGLKECDDGAALGDDKEELLCGKCSGLENISNCPKHGQEFMSEKSNFSPPDFVLILSFFLFVVMQ